MHRIDESLQLGLGILDEVYVAYEDRNVKDLNDDGIELLFHYNISRRHYEGGLLESDVHTMIEGSHICVLTPTS